MSSAEQKARCSVANELFEKSGNRRVEVNLAIAVRCLEPLFDPAVMNFLLDKDSQKSGEMCLSISMPSASPTRKPPAPHRTKIIRSRSFFHRAKPVITSDEKDGVFCLSFSTTGRSMNS